MNFLNSIKFVILFSLGITAQDCSWSYVDDTNTPGGSFQSGLKTLAECQKACQQNNACQYGFDFLPTTGQCWVSSTSSTGFMIGIQHWKCSQTVGTCNTFNGQLGMSMTGGTKNQFAANLDTCKSICVAQDTCIGLDFNTKTTECWLFKNRGNLIPNIDSNHYELNRGSCATTPAIGQGQRCTWKLVDHTISPGAVLQPGLRILADCLNACQNTPCTYGVDWNQQSGECFFAITQATTVGLGIEHYNCFREVGVKCNEFVEYLDRRIIGASRDLTASTVELCKARCVSQTACVALDFNLALNECWLHSATSATGDMLVSAGVTHYKLSRGPCGYTYTDSARTTGTTSTSPSCQLIFSPIIDTHIPGGSLDVVETTVDGCKRVCASKASCIGFDFDTSKTPNQCWTLDRKDRYETAVGVHHYFVIRIPPDCVPASPVVN